MTAVLFIICFIIGSVVTLFSYRLGLQHNYDLKHDVKPVSVIKEVIGNKKEEKQKEESRSYYSELLHDPRDE